MSIESRLAKGDNPDDVKKLFPFAVEKIDRITKERSKKSEKKTAKKKTAKA